MGGTALRRKLAAIVAADVAGYSRLVSHDETATLRKLSAYRQIVDALIDEYGGRIANTAGDSILADFASAIDAVECCVAVQLRLAAAEDDQPEDLALRFRIGIHLGDVVIQGIDLLGDGVNVAARLESIADPGGICISGAVFDQVDGKLGYPIEPLGLQRLKNISRPIEAYKILLRQRSTSPQAENPSSSKFEQQIQYCRSADGVRLAYSVVGTGPFLLKSANWINHLELDWELPLYRHLFVGLSKQHKLVRYDARGNGLSDWDQSELSLDAWVSDMEAVADAAGLIRFPIFGFSQGCAVSIAYAVRHPERVSKLILFGGFATGRFKRPSNTATDLERYKATATLIRLGWSSEDPTFRQMLASQLIPGATKEQAVAFNEMQRRSLSAESAARYYETVSNFDVRDLLPQVSVPTLVLHFREDAMVPIEEGRLIGAKIPNARFVSLPGRTISL
ncbi:alpha/beta fold hydrolase [Bradyrhizobium sp. Pa8]|uniref:alpha/beta fold hydrolase n=1 Tax=Bradyrhizobium sp. Pa8 TaxID=3386552 RepID=UPI00403F4C8F